MSARDAHQPVNWRRGHDPETLREKIDPRLAQERLRTLKDDDSLAADAERVTLLRVLGSLDQALTLAGNTVQRALAEGTATQAVGARIRLGQVHQYRGEPAAALLWLQSAFTAASAIEDPSLQSLAKVHEAKTLLEASRPQDAADCLVQALQLGTKSGASPAQLGPIEAALALAQRRIQVNEEVATNASELDSKNIES